MSAQNDTKIRQLYSDIDEELNKVPFGCIWPRFHKFDYALYTKELICLPSKVIPANLVQNKKKLFDFEGKRYILWNAKHSKAPIQDVASDLVHKMFHVFQYTRNEMRIPDEKKGLNYPDNAKNYYLKLMEGYFLSRAIMTKDTEEKRACFFDFLLKRKQRMKQYGEDLAFEYYIETVEGSAEYCGLKALSYMSEERYWKKLKECCYHMVHDSTLLFNTGQYAAYAGALLLLLAECLQIPVSKEITGNKLTIFEECCKYITEEEKMELLSDECVASISSEETIHKLYEEYIQSQSGSNQKEKKDDELLRICRI
ncbi:MAG: hypothetical protein E7256_00600 [Lachnospiraceae bacterium]|nr:hypothetical protein [Lachnospiraceae bacterium]